MKISPLDYARVLLEMTNGKSEDDIRKAISFFSQALRRHHKIDSVHRILSLYGKLFDQRNGIVQLVVRTPIPLREKEIQDIRTFVYTQYPKSQKVILEERQDKNLVGGVVLEMGDERFDMSIRKKYDQFKRILLDEARV